MACVRLLGCCVFFLSPKAAGALVSLGNYTPWRLMLGRGARVCVAAKSPENLMFVDEEELPLGEWMGMFDFRSSNEIQEFRLACCSSSWADASFHVGFESVARADVINLGGNDGRRQEKESPHQQSRQEAGQRRQQRASKQQAAGSNAAQRRAGRWVPGEGRREGCRQRDAAQQQASRCFAERDALSDGRQEPEWAGGEYKNARPVVFPSQSGVSPCPSAPKRAPRSRLRLTARCKGQGQFRRPRRHLTQTFRFPSSPPPPT